ncbi:MAG TPA: lysophospholipase [Salinivirgaceae bacterium]|nr:lysophospholipase [Salinivirgaceae bacterium]HQA75805.1 lysophospholipase [Salinivirgaceae bacterium]
MLLTEKYLNLCNNRIYVRIATSQNVKPRLAMVLIHGIGDHSGRYLDWMEKFEDLGVVWVTADLPGHGLSSGKRGHFETIQSPFCIVENLITLAKNRFAGVPIVLYGNSMGGNICVNYVIQNSPKIDGLILTSPWIGLINRPPNWKIQLAKFVSPFLKKMTLKTGVKREQLTFNEKALDNFKKDNLVHGKITLGTFLMMWDAAFYIRKNASSIKIPTLLLHGVSDNITNWRTTMKLGLKFRQKSKFKSFEGMLHELHHDTNNNLVVKEITKWLNDTFLLQYEF